MDEEKECRSVDSCTNELMAICGEEGIELSWDRRKLQGKPCKFGVDGVCCRICFMGPCRISKKSSQGVCGADADTIAARNFARMIAAGAAAHSDHGRDVAETLIMAAKGESEGYEIKDRTKLWAVAKYMEVDTEGKDQGKEEDVNAVALAVGEKALGEFGKSHGYLLASYRAPEQRNKIWDELGVRPRAIDREVVEIMHRTTMGVDQDYENIMKQGTRCALADGWGGSMVATDLQDVLFGTPKPLRSEVNLGIFKEDHVNIVVHGHEPIISELIVLATQDKDILAEAEKVGAKGIQLGGVCCTANEILMRHGIPVAGNFLQQELALVTGAIEAMVVDVQCVMQGLADIAKKFHTELITVSPKAAIRGVRQMVVEEGPNAYKQVKEIVLLAINNFPNRKGKVRIPQESYPMIAGFTDESVMYTLGGSFRASYRPLNDNIINGRIRGIAGVVGCNNVKVSHDDIHLKVVKELIANDVLVLQTGCAAIATAKAGLMTPEEGAKQAGPGLAEVCETVGIPPVLHCGACVDNSRLLIAATQVVKEGGLGDDISQLPLAGSAPEWMSEKAIAIGQYFVASGVFVVFGVGLPVLGAPNFSKYLFEDIEKEYGGKWAVEPDPHKHAQLMIEHIEAKRKKLNLKFERKLLDMAARRELEV
ncbi:MAG: anaerobic carbon-monoxide dehydrogenase catalytic subunit [Planctomycetota bacterium]|nr:MAG: anaerobic carbon-monoxide dehydrogenase catalytic subunit [Planctomycetota bacterium]